VLLVDDAVSSGASLERFAGELADEGAELAAAFVLVDMRDVAEAVTAVACSVPTDAVSTYLHVLDLAAAGGILAATVHQLSVDALVNRLGRGRPALGGADRGGLRGGPNGRASRGTRGHQTNSARYS
jgi:orotate phosphoribosyltransferase